MGLKLDGDRLPTADAAVHVDGREIGRVTSATRSPLLAANIALAYLRNLYCVAGTRATIEATVDSREGGVDSGERAIDIGAEVVDLPFAVPS